MRKGKPPYRVTVEVRVDCLDAGTFVRAAVVGGKTEIDGLETLEDAAAEMERQVREMAGRAREGLQAAMLAEATAIG